MSVAGRVEKIGAGSVGLGRVFPCWVAVLALSAVPCLAQQTVFLDFDGLRSNDTHEYPQEERDAILARVAGKFEQFDFEFVLEAPTEGEFTTIFIGLNFSEDVPGLLGFAEQIDFRNLDKTDDAFVGVDFLLTEDFGFEENPENYINLTTNVVAHELGHILGLRHGDSFGPIGSGVNNPPGPQGIGGNKAADPPIPAPKSPRIDPRESRIRAGVEFLSDSRNWCGICAQDLKTGGNKIGEAVNLITAYLPFYPGPLEANETGRHVMASGASVGQTVSEVIAGNLFFSERSATKLAFNEAGEVIEEKSSSHNDRFSAQNLGDFPELIVPNTIIQGEFADEELDTRAVVVVGEISEVGEFDYYSFRGEEGDLVNLEVISSALLGNTPTRVTEFFDPEVTIFHSDGTLVNYYGQDANNDDEFESLDSIIIDLILPEDDTYFIEVRESDFIGAPALVGEYELYVFVIKDRFSPPPPDEPDFPPDCIALGSVPEDSFLQVEGIIHSNGDIDTFCFDAEEGVDYVIRTSLDSLPDSRLKIIDLDGINVLEQNDDIEIFGQQFNLASRIEFTAPASGTYYIQVQAFSQLQRGKYQVIVSQPDAEPPSNPTGTFATARATPTRGMAPLTVNLQGGVFEEVDLEVGQWDFGDGDGDIGVSLTHTYLLPGMYLAEFTAFDDRGLEAKATVVIEVLAEPNEPPEASIVASATSGDPPLTIQFEGFGTDVDGQVVRYDWDFGDGNSGSGATIEHTYTRQGKFNAVLTVTDEDGGTGAAIQPISVGETEGLSPILQGGAGQPVPGAAPLCGSTGALTYTLTLLGLGGIGLRRRRW